MWIWVAFSSLAFAMVRYVEGAGCLVMSSWAAAAALCHRLLVRTRANDLEREATYHEQRVAQTHLGAGSESIAAVAELAGQVGDVMVGTASTLEGFAAGAATRVLANFVASSLGDDETRAHRRAASSKRAAASDLRSATWLVFVGVLLVSSVAVGLGAVGIMKTPASELEAHLRADSNRRADAQWREIERASQALETSCKDLVSSANAFDAAGASVPLSERRALVERMIAAADRWNALQRNAPHPLGEEIDRTLQETKIELARLGVHDAGRLDERHAAALRRSIRRLHGVVHRNARRIGDVSVCR